MAEVERALNAHRPDDAGRLLREVETWRALTGRWDTARFEPGGPFSVPVSPGNCLEAIHVAVFAAFPERAGLLMAQLARSLWKTGRRVYDSYPFLRADPLVADPDRYPSVVVLAPADLARDGVRAVLELGSVPGRVWISPFMVSFTFHLAGSSVVATREEHRLLVNGEDVSNERRLADGDLLTGDLSTGGHAGKLLFLDRAG